MTKDNGKGCRDKLPTALWTHRIAKLQATRASPFSLVCGIKAIIPIDLVRPVVKLAKIPREDILEVIEENRDNAISHNRLYQARHKGQVKERKFQVGELV